MLGPSLKVIPNLHIKLRVSKYEILGSAIKPVFTLGYPQTQHKATTYSWSSTKVKGTSRS